MSQGRRRIVEDLLRVSGARYCAIADGASGRLLAEAGDNAFAETGVVAWSSAVAAFLAVPRAGPLQDVMITAQRSHHLVRRVVPVAGEPLLLYVVLDRARSNLGAARRELAASVWVARLAVVAPTGSDVVPPQPLPPAVERIGSVSPVPAPRPASALPRRSDQAQRWPVPAPVAPPRPASVPRWADDLPTMRRLLAGLRGLR